MRDSPAIVRMRVCLQAGVQPSFELCRAVLALAERAEGCNNLRFERDCRIRRAGALLDGAVWPRAAKLAAETRTLDRAWRRLVSTEPVLGTVQGELHAARLFLPLPESCRGYYRVLTAVTD